MWIYQGGMRMGNPQFKCGFCGGIVQENSAGHVCPYCRRVEYGNDEGGSARSAACGGKSEGSFEAAPRLARPTGAGSGWRNGADPPRREENK